jgi:hypothetical protein
MRSPARILAALPLLAIGAGALITHSPHSQNAWLPLRTI